MTRHLLITLLALLPIVASASDVCGSPGEKPSKRAISVDLPGSPATPAFYYRLDMYHVAYVTETKMSAYLDALKIQNTESPSATLVNAIRHDMPLRENRDLFQYNFSSWEYIGLIESLVMGLAEEGGISIVAPGGHEVKQITILYDRQPDITLTRLYAGKKGINEVLVTRGCIAD